MEPTRRDGTPAAEPSPARGYSWPPFETGNMAAVSHGARSPRLVADKAREVLTELKETLPYLKWEDEPTVDALVREAARYRMLDDWISDVVAGVREARGGRKDAPRTGVEAVPDRVWQAVDRAGRAMVTAAGKLGMNPADRAKLYRDAGMAFHFGPHTGLEALAGTARKFKRLRTLPRTPLAATGEGGSDEPTLAP